MNKILFVTFFILFFALANLFGIKPQLVTNQISYIVIAFGAYFACRQFGWHFFRNNSKLIYWIFVGLLIVTYIIGFEARGSKRWIDLYFFNFQPSEFFKVFFIVFLADYFVRNRKIIDEVSVFLKSLVYFAIPFLIIFKQPDLGNATVFLFIYLAILFFTKVPKKNIFYTFLIFVISLPLLWFTLRDYQKQRVISFVDPHYDQRGTGYNMIQAVITVGSGKFFGRGMGFGTQSNLLFLPENHTDFAFSSLIEQFGFFGGLCTLILYFLFAVFLINKIMRYYGRQNENDYFKFLYTLGFFSYFIFQTLVNIAMNIGLFPIVGIALPLLSYGGSAVVAFFIGLALLPKN